MFLPGGRAHGRRGSVLDCRSFQRRSARDHEAWTRRPSATLASIATRLTPSKWLLVFEKVSLRTRLAFETVGINTMGGNAIFVDQTSSPLGERETIADVAKNLERWADVIVLRTYAHDTITEMAANSRVPVINALSDFEHPCQALADFMTIEEHFGTAAGLNFTYVGDGNNVCHSLMLTGAQLGANVTVATPRGYSPRYRDRDQGAGHCRRQWVRDPPPARSSDCRRGRRCNLYRRLRQHGHGGTSRPSERLSSGRSR